MPSYKLTYFNGRGRAEIARLCFAASGTQYEDCRIEQASWPAMKASLPLGQLPVLEVDGKILCQCSAIYRFLAREFGLCGANSWEAAKIDEIVCTMCDVFSSLATIHFEKDEAKKAELKKKQKEENLPMIIKYLADNLKNNGGNGFLVGKKLTVADLAVYNCTSLFSNIGVEPLLDPNVKSHMERIGAIPAIKKWVESRPVTPM